MKTIYRHKIKPLFITKKRPAKEDRRKVQPLFWLEPHLNRHHGYLVIYVPGRFFVAGWTVFRQPLRRVA